MFSNTLKALLILIMGSIIGMIIMFFILIGGVKDDNFKGNSIDFKYVGKIPVITVEMNGKSADLIVDSGASISVLNKEDGDFYGYNVGAPTNFTINGYGGTVTSMNLATNTHLTVNGKKIKASFKLNDISHVIDVMEAKTHTDIIGILGSDVCAKYGFIIDYYNKKIYLSKYNKVEIVRRDEK